MKKILCILDSLNTGGAETFLMKLSRCTPPEVCRFDFVVSYHGGVYYQEVLDRGGKVFVVPPRRKDLPGAFEAIRRIVKENGYDSVLKLGDSPLLSIDLIAAKLGGAQKLGFRSCNALTGLSVKEMVIDSVMRPVLNWSANVKLAPSMLAAEYTFGKRHAHKDVQLIHNGVDLSIFCYKNEGRERIRKEFSLAGKLVIGHVGRLTKQKNHRFLLDVFCEIRKKRTDAVLLLVGTGELEAQIRIWVQELGLEPYVIFAGTRLDIPDMLSAMDVFVFPSFHEGMPNTVIEAQATGLPCVIADTITREADITGLVQYLSLNNLPEVWANAALTALAPERRDTAPDFLENHYDIQSVAKHFLELLCPEE